MNVTVGVNTYKGSRRVNYLLRSLDKHREGPFNVVLLDDGSPDGGESVRSLAKKYNTDFIGFEHNKGIPAAWNALVEKNKSDISIIFNDDVIVTKDWYNSIVGFMEKNPQAGGAGYPQYFTSEEDYDRIIEFGTQHETMSVVPRDPLTKQPDASKWHHSWWGRAGRIMCQPPESLIVTEKGVRPIAEIQKGDYVFTHLGRWRKVSRTYSRSAKEDVYSIITGRVGKPLRLTGEHPVLIVRPETCRYHKGFCTLIKERTCTSCNHSYKNTPKWLDARDVRRGDFVLMPIISDTVEKECIDLAAFHDFSRNFQWKVFVNSLVCRKKSYTRYISITPEFCYFLGLFIGNGNASVSYKGGTICLSFGVKKRCIAKRTVQLFYELFGLSASCRECFYQGRVSSISVVVSSLPLAKCLQKLCGKGAKNKQMPWWALKLPICLQEFLLLGLNETDGCVRGDITTYDTVSNTLAYQYFQLHLRMKKIPSLSYTVRTDQKDRGSFKNTGPIYHITIRDFNVTGFILDNYAYLPVTEVRKAVYAGPLCNLEVEQDNSFTDFGRVVHNCAAGACFAIHYDKFNLVKEWNKQHGLTGGFPEEYLSFHEESHMFTVLAMHGFPSYGLTYPQVWHLWSATFRDSPELNAGWRMAHSRQMYCKVFGVPEKYYSNPFRWTHPHVMSKVPPYPVTWMNPDGKWASDMDPQNLYERELRDLQSKQD